MDEKIKELTLMLLYLTSWEEKEMGLHYQRSWKGYDFDVLNALADEELVIDSKRSKSVAISPDGMEKAKELLRQYGLSD